MKERLVECIKMAVPPSVWEWAEVIADAVIDDGWIRPPFKAGQTVYCIADGISEVMEGRVRGVWILEDGSQKFDTIIKGYFPHRYTPEDIGKTVFFNREEALNKLKEGGQR